MSRYGSYGLASSYRSSYLDSGTGSTSSYTSPTYSSYSSPTTALPYESKFEALTAGRGSRAGEDKKSEAAKKSNQLISVNCWPCEVSPIYMRKYYVSFTGC